MLYYLQNGEDFKISLECAFDCSRPGANDEAVAAWADKIDEWPTRVGMELDIRDNGLRSETELAKMSYEDVQELFLWIAAHSFKD